MNVADESHRSPDEPNAAATASGRRQETPEVGTVQLATGRPKFRLRKVLIVVVPVAVLAVVVVALAGVLDVDTILSDLTRPALAPATGQVLFHGQPLRNGQIMTQPTEGRGLSAIGWTDDEGKFTLKTDIRGNYVDGATVGEHRVTVAAFLPATGPGAPALLTPQQYASEGTSPLRITIRSNPADNQFQFVLEGEAPSRPQGAGKRGGKGKSKNKAKTETPTPAEPEASAETTGATENESKSEPGENRETESKAENESAKTPVDESDYSDPLIAGCGRKQVGGVAVQTAMADAQRRGLRILLSIINPCATCA